MSSKPIQASPTPWRSRAAGGPTNSGFIFVGLKPFEQRNGTSSQIIDRLRPKLLSVPAQTPFCRPRQDLRIGGRRKQRAISVHDSERQFTGSGAVGPGACSSRCGNYGCSPTSIPTSRTAVFRPGLPMTARPLRASALPRRCSTTLSTKPSAKPRFPPCIPPSTSTTSCWKSNRSTGSRR